MDTFQTHLTTTFAALSDPTRLAVVERLLTGPASVSDLAEPFAMAGPSFLKHLKVLEGAGLVTSAKAGRVRTVEVVPERLFDLADWFENHKRRWSERFDRLGQLLKDED
jgi:DNA-binding transcriptional ArsR family regulator